MCRSAITRRETLLYSQAGPVSWPYRFPAPVKLIMTKNTIFIMDDDPDIVEGMRVMLEAKGYSVLFSHDYSAGLAAIRSVKPDLIILDATLMLNDKSGLQLPTELRNDPGVAHIPVLMITAINDGLTGEEFAPGTDDPALPIDGFINKPARSEDLYAQVESLLKLKTSKWAARFTR